MHLWNNYYSGGAFILKKYLPFVIGCAVGYLITLVLILIFAFLFLSDALTSDKAPIASIIALAVGSFVGGYITAFVKKEKGLVNGFITGLIMFLLVLSIALFNDSQFTVYTLVKAIVMLLLSSAGGILGVNKAQRRKMI